MTTQIAVYNQSLQILGEPKLATVTDEIESRRAIDVAYSQAVEFCLEAGQWWFATKEAEISKDATAPSFGFQNRFAKPTDWLRTMALSADEFFSCPLIDASDQPDWWYANVDPLYVRYVSDNASFGNDLTRWPASFVKFVTYEIAERTCLQLTQSAAKLEVIKRDKIRAKRDALSKDAMNDVQPKFPPSGSFVRSRLVGGVNSSPGTYRSGTYYR